MAAAAPIVINDGATTPVAHTFTPEGRDQKGILWFVETSPAPVNPLGARRLGYQQIADFRKGTGAKLDSVTKCVYTLYSPSLETLSNNSAGITPPPQVAYQEDVRIEFNVANRSAKQERKDHRTLTGNLILSAVVGGNLDDLLPTY